VKNNPRVQKTVSIKTVLQSQFSEKPLKRFEPPLRAKATPLKRRVNESDLPSK
jgi:hypothetical protein